MLRRICVTAAAIGIATAADAAAAPVAGDYGGGSVPDSIRRAQSRLVLLSARLPSPAEAIVYARVQSRCGSGEVRRRVAVAPDGSFSFTTTRRDHPRENRRVRRRATTTVAGRFDGAVASGTASTRLVFRLGGRVVARCKSGPRAWQMRAVAAEPAPGAARAGATDHGLTGQAGTRPRAFALRVDRRARRIVTEAFEYRLRCSRTGAIAMSNITPGTRIRADGSFARTERFAIRYTDAVERFVVRLRGRFTPNGVNGTLSVRSVARAFSGRVTDRCRTGTVGFAAAP